MSKLYNKYIDKKKENNNKLYLFKSGNFYIFLGEDAKVMLEELGYNFIKIIS